MPTVASPEGDMIYGRVHAAAKSRLVRIIANAHAVAAALDMPNGSIEALHREVIQLEKNLEAVKGL